MTNPTCLVDGVVFCYALRRAASCKVLDWRAGFSAMHDIIRPHIILLTKNSYYDPVIKTSKICDHCIYIMFWPAAGIIQ